MRPRPLLFVLHWLVVGGEETEVRLLAQYLRPEWTVDVVVCQFRPMMPDQTHVQLAELGIPVDTTPYGLGDDQIVEHLAPVIPTYDVVVACQAVPYVHPALRRLARRPPLIEHGGLVSEALTGPTDLTDRYVGVCASIRDAAASRMPDRPQDALEIPSMVDFDPAARADVRREWGVADDVPMIGWVGRLDRKKRVEDVLAAAALLAQRRPEARWMIIGGPNFFYPEHETALHDLAARLELGNPVRFLGDRADVPRLLAGLDALVWLSEGEGMPHVLAEAGAAGLPVVVTRDNGSEQQVVDGRSGLFVPRRDPSAVADALVRLIDDPGLRRWLGTGLRRTVEQRYAVEVVVPQWRVLLDDIAIAGR
ncbi:Glycosyl transferases group 1 [Modestobacter sp. DSM 44400]|uniref:glycosyltransferase family 4 protein n=1 Tax=Modestobacter sp. DSM 44400 TaxID=1550230 RepID=UPI000896FC70|nr:glycosyltransferase family 4 protein [Modestobacter sp. DSM 44400]SDY92429.1 Glycosyl transferases group 1 [Modestobacter sp. DSM 44400]